MPDPNNMFNSEYESSKQQNEDEEDDDDEGLRKFPFDEEDE